MSAGTVETGTDEDGTGTFGPLRDVVGALRDSASVERVYGDPITAGERTLVPVARVAYGFGGGFGSGTDEDGESAGEGGGVGGGVSASPVGVLEVTDAGTRFVRFDDWKRLTLAVGAGVVLGLLLGRR